MGFVVVGDIKVGGCKSTGDVVGSAANLVEIMGESALFEGAKGRFFKIEVLLLFTSLIILIVVGVGAGFRSSSN